MRVSRGRRAHICTHVHTHAHKHVHHDHSHPSTHQSVHYVQAGVNQYHTRWMHARGCHACKSKFHTTNQRGTLQTRRMHRRKATPPRAAHTQTRRADRATTRHIPPARTARGTLAQSLGVAYPKHTWNASAPPTSGTVPRCRVQNLAAMCALSQLFKVAWLLLVTIPTLARVHVHAPAHHPSAS